MASSDTFTSFAQVAEYLDRLGHFRMTPDLERVRAVLGTLRARRLPGAAAQIAGTNGKGSVTTFLASLGRAAGLRTGLFLSPHFVSFRERVRIDGAMLPEETWVGLANRVLAAGGESLTYFEFITAAGALAFCDASVDLAALETGLGGSWDAVTALEADLVLFTPIGLDHCHILGDTLAAIATDKAGAIRPERPVVSAPQEEPVLRVLTARAARLNCVLRRSSPNHGLPESVRSGATPLRLAGRHQLTNAALALDGWRILVRDFGWPNGPATELEGLRTAFIPGRLQFVPASKAHGHPALLLDGAHNPHGLAALGLALAERNIAPAAVVFSCLRDKTPEHAAANLRALATGPVFVPPIPDNPRGMPPTELAALIGPRATAADSLDQALELAAAHTARYLPREAAEYPEQHPVLLCGSLYLLGHFYARRPECLDG